jgi:NTP pyrophosphatase (non-canonical NTP hydrolase)
MNLRKLQFYLKEWTRHNFPNAEPAMPVMGNSEEIGEMGEVIIDRLLGYIATVTAMGRINHGFLKRWQGIRGTPEEHTKKIKDAIGDQVVFLANLCNLEGWDMQEIVEETWEKVSQRDWQKCAATGGEKPEVPDYSDLVQAAQTFCERVEKGEVSSNLTYRALRLALQKAGVA